MNARASPDGVITADAKPDVRSARRTISPTVSGSISSSGMIPNAAARSTTIDTEAIGMGAQRTRGSDRSGSREVAGEGETGDGMDPSVVTNAPPWAS